MHHTRNFLRTMANQAGKSTRLFEGNDHANVYSKYRPFPPAEIFDKIYQFLGEKVPPNSNDQKWKLAVDVGCGTGQCANLLAPNFDQIRAFDVSEGQISEAQVQAHPDNVHYQVR